MSRFVFTERSINCCWMRSLHVLIASFLWGCLPPSIDYRAYDKPVTLVVIPFEEKDFSFGVPQRDFLPEGERDDADLLAFFRKHIYKQLKSLSYFDEMLYQQPENRPYFRTIESDGGALGAENISVPRNGAKFRFEQNADMVLILKDFRIDVRRRESQEAGEGLPMGMSTMALIPDSEYSSIYMAGTYCLYDNANGELLRAGQTEAEATDHSMQTGDSLWNECVAELVADMFATRRTE